MAFVTSLLLSSLIMFMETPQWLIFILIVQTLSVTLITIMTKLSICFPLILLLVFLGGLMVIFSYTVSLTAKFKFVKFGYFTPLLMVMSLNMFFLSMFSETLTVVGETAQMDWVFSYSNMGLWSGCNLNVYLFTTIYLLLTLLNIAFLLKFNKGPMRSMME